MSDERSNCQQQPILVTNAFVWDGLAAPPKHVPEPLKQPFVEKRTMLVAGIDIKSHNISEQNYRINRSELILLTSK